jgi:hypothetical protein
MKRVNVNNIESRTLIEPGRRRYARSNDACVMKSQKDKVTSRNEIRFEKFWKEMCGHYAMKRANRAWMSASRAGSNTAARITQFPNASSLLQPYLIGLAGCPVTAGTNSTEPLCTRSQGHKVRCLREAPAIKHFTQAHPGLAFVSGHS